MVGPNLYGGRSGADNAAAADVVLGGRSGADDAAAADVTLEVKHPAAGVPPYHGVPAAHGCVLGGRSAAPVLAGALFMGTSLHGGCATYQ
eukprot:1159206-Pelagomonas_calceolata.AAC.5